MCNKHNESEKIKSLSQIDNIEDLKKYEDMIIERGCPVGEPGEPGVKEE